MKDEAEDEAGCRARELLPCHCTVKAGDYHTVDCPANYRDDIAAALREAHHCKDCCCARSWQALGVLDNKGMSIPEHIDKLMARLEEQDGQIDRADEHTAKLMESLDKVERDVAKLREERDAGLQLTGSFFEALKPLRLESINVANPGEHVTELIAERDAAYVRGLETALGKLEVGGFHGATLDYILMFRRHIQAEIEKAGK